MGLGIIDIDHQLLIDALHLPPGTRIINVSDHANFDRDIIAIKVEHPDLPPLSFPGESIRRVKPQYRSVPVTYKPVFDGWH